MRETKCAIAVLILFLCLAITPAAAGDPPKLVGLALPEAGTDKGWNEQGKVGLEIVAEKYGFKIELAEALGYGDIKPTRPHRINLSPLYERGATLSSIWGRGSPTIGLNSGGPAVMGHDAL